MKNYVLGIDYGTDSCRALIADAATGREAAMAVSPYKRWAEGRWCDPRTNRYRQHPQDYIDALQEAVREAVAALPAGEAQHIRGMCFGTTGSTPVLVDAAGTPLALLPGMEEEPDAMFVLWKDHTSIAEAGRINALAHRWPVDYTAYSGGIYSPEWVWAKVLRIVGTNPRVAEAACSWSEHCDWITGLVTGHTAPATMVRSRCAAGHKAMWHASWGLPAAEFLAELHPALARMRPHLYRQTQTSGSVAGTLTGEWAQRLGLPPGIAVSVGALDGHMGAVGACTAPHVLTRIIGTSTCDIMTVDSRALGERPIPGICGQVDGSVVPGYTGLEAGQSAFGDLYAWLCDLLAWPLREFLPASAEREKMAGEILGRLSEQAAALSPSPGGIVALDWMNGRRTPYADPNVQGVLAGLTLGSDAPALLRALIEATAFGSKAIVDHLAAQGVRIDAVNATGGISHKSPLVMQVLCDVLGVPIRVVNYTQTCALGAAMCAAVAAGIYPDVEQAQRHMGSGYSAQYSPDEQNRRIYMELYEKYRLAAQFAQTIKKQP